MSGPSLLLNLITPSRLLEENKAVLEIKIPAYYGEMSIFPGHAPLVTTLSEGVLSYKVQETKLFKYIALSWGYLEISPLGVKVLAETAERGEEIEKIRSEEALKTFSLKLENITEMDPIEIESLQRKVRRARARIKAFELAHKVLQK